MLYTPHIQLLTDGQYTLYMKFSGSVGLEVVVPLSLLDYGKCLLKGISFAKLVDDLKTIIIDIIIIVVIVVRVGTLTSRHTAVAGTTLTTAAHTQ